MVLLILEDGKHGRGESRSWIQSGPGFKGTNNRGKGEGVDWLGIKAVEIVDLGLKKRKDSQTEPV